METSKLLRNTTSDRGFSVVEVLISLAIFAVGLVMLSALGAQTLNNTARSRFMGLAANFASEKLEDLNRWPSTECRVAASSGSTNGSLTSDATATVSCSGTSTTMYYYDDVDVNNSTGAVSQTYSKTVAGVFSYVTIIHRPDGTVTQGSTTPSAADVGAIGFHRRWTIEMDQPVTGVRRITVLVTLENGYMKPPVSYQMSMVRP